MSILVTGGAGFIGSHLCEYLLEKGHEVICVDNYFTGNKENIRHLLSNKNFEAIRHDIVNPLFLDLKIDQIYNLACPASPIHYQKNPIKTIKMGTVAMVNMLGMAKAKRARILQASTSEVYGDPKVHPQPESYLGNVNCIGPRSCYDEGKRVAESLMMAYHWREKVDTRIVRIFNSILADQPVVVLNDKKFHLEKISDYVNKLNKKKREILVPSFDPKSLKISLSKVSAVIKHPYIGDAYEIKISYGRSIKVTGDHSLFKRDKNGKPLAIPVREFKVGDYVAIPSKLPVIEKDFKDVCVSDYLLALDSKNLWEYVLVSEKFKSIVPKHKNKIYKTLNRSKRFKSKSIKDSVINAYCKYKREGILPLSVFKHLNINLPADAKIRIYKGGARILTPNNIKLTNDILWLLGFFIAECCSQYKEGKNYFLTFSSDKKYLNKAKKILEDRFGVYVVERKKESTRSAAIFIHSKILHFVFDKIFKVVKNKKTKSLRIPSWIFQLPLSRLKFFLEGYREGDGTHSGKKLGKRLCFDTSDKDLALDLNMLLLRFGLVASLGGYKTKYKQKYGDRLFPFYRLTLCKLSTFDILRWDKGVKQKLLARRAGDLVWAMVKTIKKCNSSKYVYDFSVPSKENFIAGNGICCHNTFGPKMAMNDGRVISNFIVQALKNKPISVYGKGSQTRSFCYVSDMVEALYRVMNLDGFHEPINVGNPGEFTILELAVKIKEMTKSKSKIVFKELPEDDPEKRKPDISLAKKLIGWEPKVLLDEGLKETIDYFKTVV